MATAPPVIATLATSAAVADLYLLLNSLQFWNTQAPTVYIYCDDALAAKLSQFAYKGLIKTRPVLELYAAYDRAAMEKTRGYTYRTLWADFMAEKIALMEWAVKENPGGVLFCDADICFLGPLPAIPAGTRAALSPHFIRQADEAKFGRYNGGFFWCSDLELLTAWRAACADARYYEQSALEEMAVAAGPALYEFPIQHNYGWWRLWQGEDGPAARMHGWTMNRHKAGGGVGILVDGKPLVSVHTHFGEQQDQATAQFNQWVVQWLQKLSNGHQPARKFYDSLVRIFPHLKAPHST